MKKAFSTTRRNSSSLLFQLEKAKTSQKHNLERFESHPLDQTLCLDVKDIRARYNELIKFENS